MLSQKIQIAGVIFDMDGTLVDSEPNTERCIRELLRQHGLSAADLDWRQFHGLTWKLIEALLVKHFPVLSTKPVATQLQNRFHQMFADLQQPPPYIPGAPDFLSTACQLMPTAIATSSNRESLDFFLKRVGLQDRVTVCLSAEDYTRSKPDPECYLMAAKRLGIEPSSCLVFEDSRAGLRAAKDAGMWAVAIDSSHVRELAHLADLVVADYTALEPNFLASLQGQV